MKYVLSLFLILVCMPAHSHTLAPSLLEIKELTNNIFDVLWRTPSSREFQRPQPTLPQSCGTISPLNDRITGSAFEMTWQISCPQGLDNQDISIVGLTSSRTAALIKIELADKRSYNQLIRHDDQTFTVPATASTLKSVVQYFLLGIEHILIGLDHLLFVTGLLLLATSWQQLLLTVSAFTIGHSVTLVFVSLGIIPNIAVWVELAIAATILYLAIYLSYGKRHGVHTRWPLIVIFGLIHGLGFASVLKELGLPQTDVVASLVAFNIGIEAGQLLFVVGLGALLKSMSMASGRTEWLMRKVAVYTMGGMAVFWCLDRGYGLWVGSQYYW